MRLAAAMVAMSGCLWGQAPAADPFVLATAIARMEGWWSGPEALVRRQHNPCALVFAGQRAAERGAGGYARFRTDGDGWAACERDLRLKLARGLGPAAIIDVWTTDPVARSRYRVLFRQLRLLP